MVVPGVRIGSAPGLVLYCDEQLLRTRQGERVTRKDRTVVSYNDLTFVAVLDMDGATVEFLAVLLEYEVLNSVLRDGINRQHNAIFPDFDGHEDLHALAQFEAPIDVTRTLRLAHVPNDQVGQVDEEPERPGCRINLPVNEQDRQIAQYFRLAATVL